MRRLFLVLVLLAVCVAGLGFYLGWFRLGSDDADGKTHITFTVDKDKIKADEKKALDKVHGAGGPATTAAPSTAGEKSTDENVPSTPIPRNQD